MCTHRCDHCGAEATSEEKRMYLDCSACGIRNGMRFQNPYGDGQNIFKFDHKNGTNTYSQIKFRPRGIG